MRVLPFLFLILGAACIAATTWFSGLGLVLWSTGTKALPDDIGFGYYSEFNKVRKVIKQSACVKSMEFGRHEDITLEGFNFKVRTESGLAVRLWFNDSMDVEQVCSEPRGFVVQNPWNNLRQGLQPGTPVSNVRVLGRGELALRRLKDRIIKVFKRR